MTKCRRLKAAASFKRIIYFLGLKSSLQSELYLFLVTSISHCSDTQAIEFGLMLYKVCIILRLNINKQQPSPMLKKLLPSS